jgi:hypothetical protein
VSVEDERRRTCIVVAFVDDSLRAYDFLDEDSAARWYGECGQEWNAGRSVVFYLRPARRLGGSSVMHSGDEVAHLELTTPEDAQARGVECSPAVIFG